MHHRQFLPPARNAAIFKQAFIDLLAHLHSVAAIDKDRRMGERDRGKAGRSAKSGEPAQTLGIFADIFAHMFIANRHDKTVEFAAFQFFAKGLQTGVMGLHQHRMVFLLGFARSCRAQMNL